MSANAHTPTKIFDSVVDTLHAGVADALHGVPAKGANARGLVTLSHVYGISSVSEVKATSHLALLEGSDLVARRYRQAKTRCGHSFGHCFKSHSWVAKSQRQKGRDGAT